MTVLMFQPRFAPKVVDGSKPHTIRPERKRPIKVGDHLSLRRWAGSPYRSKQIALCEVVCTRVESIRISYSSCDRPIVLDGVLLSDAAVVVLAIADGFGGPIKMVKWFASTHCLPFHGVLIGWATA